MKTLIIGMFSLALITSVSAWGASPPQPSYPGTIGQQNATNAICNAPEKNPKGNSVVLIIMVDVDSNISATACPRMGATGPFIDATHPADLPSDMSVVSVGNLGTIVKYKKNNEPDPCIWWVINGTSYLYCW